MLIKRIDATNFDSFWGTGWDNWARFETQFNPETHQKFLRQVKGIEVPKPVMNELLGRFIYRNRQPVKE